MSGLLPSGHLLTLLKLLSLLNPKMAASLLSVSNRISDDCGPSDGGRYDFSDACSLCGTGALRIDPICLRSELLEDRVCATFLFEIVIPRRLVPALKAVAPKCLRDVLDVTTREPTGSCELIPELYLPPWSPSTSGLIRSKQLPPCVRCGRDGHYNTIKMEPALVYDILLPQFKVAGTYERFGRSGLRPDIKKSKFSHPLLMVDDSVREVLMNEEGVSFQPVRFSN